MNKPLISNPRRENQPCASVEGCNRIGLYQVPGYGAAFCDKHKEEAKTASKVRGLALAARAEAYHSTLIGIRRGESRNAQVHSPRIMPHDIFQVSDLPPSASKAQFLAAKKKRIRDSAKK